MPAVYDVPDGLRSSWVDQARVITRESTGVKVRGTTRYERVFGPWFPCRLNVTDASPESRGQRGRVKVVEGPQLSYSLVSTDGESDIELGMEDQLEVVSNQEGDGVWEVTAKPMLIRTLTDLLGGAIVTVRRVVEPGQAS